MAEEYERCDGVQQLASIRDARSRREQLKRQRENNAIVRKLDEIKARQDEIIDLINKQLQTK